MDRIVRRSPHTRPLRGSAGRTGWITLQRTPTPSTRPVPWQGASVPLLRIATHAVPALAPMPEPQPHNGTRQGGGGSRLRDVLVVDALVEARARQPACPPPRTSPSPAFSATMRAWGCGQHNSGAGGTCSHRVKRSTRYSISISAIENAALRSASFAIACTLPYFSRQSVGGDAGGTAGAHAVYARACVLDAPDPRATGVQRPPSEAALLAACAAAGVCRVSGCDASGRVH